MTNTQLTFSIALIVAMTATVSGCHRDSNLSEQEHIQRAKDFEEKGNLRGSIVELKNAIEENPSSPQARLLLGHIYLKAGRGAEAENELSKAEKLGVNRETIKVELGQALLLMGDYKRVLDEIQPGSQTSKTNLARIQQIRADALLNEGKLSDACSLYQQSIKTDTGNAPSYWGLAKCALAQGNPAQAKQWLDTALRIPDRQADTWVYMGDLSLENNDVQAALTAYTNSLEAEPTNLRALEDRTRTYLLSGQAELARKDLDRLQKVAPKSVVAYYLEALFDFRQAKYPEARDALQEVFKITDNHVPSILLAGATAYSLGSYQEAETYLNRVLVRFPANGYARRVLAATQIKLNQPNAALETLSPLLSADTKNIEALSLAGEASLQTKDFNKAMEYLERASKLAPQNAAIRTQLATGEMAAGDNEKALADLERAVTLSANPGRADLALVVMHLSRGEYDAALQAISALEKKLPNNPVTQNLRAGALLAKKDRVGARRALEQALAVQPDFFPAAMNLARLDIAENNLDAARKMFASIVAKDKTNIPAMMALANLAGIQGNDSEAVLWLEKAAKADPKAVMPRVAIARYYLIQRDRQKALMMANELITTNPDNAQALNLLGAVQMAMGNRAASISTFTRLTEKAPQSPASFVNLGLAQFANGQFNPARLSLQKAIQLDPDLLQGLDALMRVELADHNPDAAREIARRMQARHPNSPLGFDREGDIELSQKHVALAVHAYEQALAKGAGSDELIKLHRALILSGDAKAAEQRLSTWIGKNPQDVAVRGYAAAYYLANHRDRDAIAQYEAVLRLAPQNAVALNNLAGLYQREKDNRALATAEQAYRLAPNNSGVADTLGWILVDQGQLPRATELLVKAASMSPKVATIRYHYGVALAKAGRNAEAKKEIEAAIAMGQPFAESAEAKALLNRL
ncbi:MAG: XrtA/PEP-CTERM system TPR-repeat protein PrsT [Thiobacillaceae bacterium]